MTEPKEARIIDFRLPLPWLITTVGSLALVLVGMWFTLAQVSRDVAELQTTVKLGNTQSVSLARDIDRLVWRVEQIEKSQATTARSGR